MRWTSISGEPSQVTLLIGELSQDPHTVTLDQWPLGPTKHLLLLLYMDGSMHHGNKYTTSPGKEKLTMHAGWDLLLMC